MVAGRLALRHLFVPHKRLSDVSDADREQCLKDFELVVGKSLP